MADAGLALRRGVPSAGAYRYPQLDRNAARAMSIRNVAGIRRTGSTRVDAGTGRLQLTQNENREVRFTTLIKLVFYLRYSRELVTDRKPAFLVHTQ